MFNAIHKKVTDWLVYESPSDEVMPYDFDRLKTEIKPGDVLLIEGRSRVSSVIRTITQSPWTHAALYIGRLIDIEDEESEAIIRKHINTKDKSRLIVEGLMDRGTVVESLNTYRTHHIRICRPIGITPTDIAMVLRYAIQRVGQPYNVRQLFDLARFMLPWSILPRRWGSSLFRTSSGEPEPGVCSSMIAEAFSSVQFPILPYIKPAGEVGEAPVEIFQRNPYLFSPKDFDYSPYFEIIKYPLFNPDEPLPYYRRLPWARSGAFYQDQEMERPSKKKRSEKSDNNTDQNIAGEE